MLGKRVDKKAPNQQCPRAEYGPCYEAKTEGGHLQRLTYG